MIKHTSIAMAALAGASVALSLHSYTEAEESISGHDYKLSNPVN